MTRKVAPWLLAVTLILACHANARAEEVTPSLVQYRFGKIPGKNTDECGILLLISSYPSPEIATVRYSLIHGLKDGRNILGLVIEVKDAVFKNGQTEKFSSVVLASASFATDNFSSEGRLLGGPQQDGSVWLYSPSDAVSSAMTTAFQLGNSRLSFSRAGSGTVRSYAIHEAVPSEVTDQFIACTRKMLGS